MTGVKIMPMPCERRLMLEATTLQKNRHHRGHVQVVGCYTLLPIPAKVFLPVWHKGEKKTGLKWETRKENLHYKTHDGTT